MKHDPTPEKKEGAREERRAWVVELKRMQKQIDNGFEIAIIPSLLAFASRRAAATGRIRGGVGRK